MALGSRLGNYIVCKSLADLKPACGHGNLLPKIGLRDTRSWKLGWKTNDHKSLINNFISCQLFSVVLIPYRRLF